MSAAALACTSFAARRLARFDLGDTAEVVGARKPCVLVANHWSLFDFVLNPILGAELGLRLVSPMQARYFELPVIRHWLVATGFHPVRAERPGLDLHGLIGRCRESGESPIMPATARLTPPEAPLEVAEGFALVARALRLPVIAVAFAGTTDVIEPTRLMPRLRTPFARPTVTVRARVVCEDPGEHSRLDLTTKATDTLAALLGRPLAARTTVALPE